jgi:thioredoxin 1
LPSNAASPTPPDLFQPALTLADSPTLDASLHPAGIATSMINFEPIQIGDDQFTSTVLESPLPVVVDFWAPWCGPCRLIAPLLDKLAKDYAGKLRVARINTDEFPQNAEKYRVVGIPTLLFFRDGELVHRQFGFLPEKQLRQMVEDFLASP